MRGAPKFIPSWVAFARHRSCEGGSRVRSLELRGEVRLARAGGVSSAQRQRLEAHPWPGVRGEWRGLCRSGRGSPQGPECKAEPGQVWRPGSPS